VDGHNALAPALRFPNPYEAPVEIDVIEIEAEKLRTAQPAI